MTDTIENEVGLIRREMSRSIKEIEQHIDLLEAHWREATDRPSETPWAIRAVRRLFQEGNFSDLVGVTCQAANRKRMNARFDYLASLTPEIEWQIKAGKGGWVLNSRPKDSAVRFSRRGPVKVSKAHCLAHMAHEIKKLGVLVDC